MAEEPAKSTAVSHFVLSGTTIYCTLPHDRSPIEIPLGSFGLILANSAIGTLRHAMGESGEDLQKAYETTTLIQDMLVLPCVVCGLWLKYDYNLYLAYAHPIISCVPVAAFLADKKDQDAEYAVVGLNTISMLAVSILHKNWHGAAAAVVYAGNYFGIKENGRDYFKVPQRDWYNYGLCLFTLLAFVALGNSLDINFDLKEFLQGVQK